MKNKLNVLLVLAIILFVAFGCGITNQVQKSITGDKSTPSPSSDSNKSVVDKTIDNVADGETTGVQECDDLIGFLKEQSEKPDDNWVTKGIRDYAIGQVKKSLRESIEQNKNDKAKMAEQCTDLKKKLENQLKAEQEKNNNK